jgi:serine/threonine protein phosphatase PrpC
VPRAKPEEVLSLYRDKYFDLNVRHFHEKLRRCSFHPTQPLSTLQPGDVLVLCTDGLYDELSDEAIAEIASQNKPADEIARELVAHAAEVDGNDNATAQVIRVRAVEQVGMYRGRPYRPSS